MEVIIQNRDSKSMTASVQIGWSNQQGYHILRFSNEEVMNDIENVIKTIELYFK